MHQKVSMNKKKRIPHPTPIKKKYNKTEKSQQKLSQQ